jgi:pimeloyl-ACP methyl ester carboxylesterase
VRIATYLLAGAERSWNVRRARLEPSTPALLTTMNASAFHAQRPLVLCLHSSGSSSRQWQPLADRAGSRFNVIAPDLHGHGAGPAWLGEPAAILEADTVRIARLISVDRPAHLVGHSYGGALALRIAAHFPERVRSVTIYEPVTFAALRDHLPRGREALDVQALGRTVARDVAGGFATHAARRFADYWSGAGTYAAMPASRRASLDRRMPAVAAHFTALWSDDVGLADLRSCRVPLTLLSGNRTRATTRRIAELIRFVRPDASGGLMTAMDHLGPITHPAIMAQRFEAALVAHERQVVRRGERLAA